MRIKASTTIGDVIPIMARDIGATPIEAAAVVKRNVDQGLSAAQRIARAASGPHGRFFYKRYTSEMTGATTGEWGPEGPIAGVAVGGGWRNGPPNTDIPKSGDLQAVKFFKDVADLADSRLW